MEPETLPEQIAEHLSKMPEAKRSDGHKEDWWTRALELHQQALDEGYVMEGDPEDEW